MAISQKTALFSAIRTKLLANSAVAAIIGDRILNNVPTIEVFPYMLLLRPNEQDRSYFSEKAYEIAYELHLFSSLDTDLELFTLDKAVEEVIDRQGDDAISLSIYGYQLVRNDKTFDETMEEEDMNGFITRHMIIKYTALIDKA